MGEELPVVGAIVHDMAGMLSNVSAFAGILESRPDHPGRGEFLPILAKEARSASDALKDLQLARTLAEPWPAAHLTPVLLARALRAVAEGVGHKTWLDGPLSDLPEDKTVTGDEGVFIGLMARVLDVSVASDTSRPAPLEVAVQADGVLVTINVTGAAYEGDLRADIERGRRELRPIALLRGVVTAWGGSSELSVSDERVEVILSLAS